MKEAKTVTLTYEQWINLNIYLRMTTQHRKGEFETWEKLAKEKRENGEPKFKNAKANASFWEILSDQIETIIKEIDRI